MAEIEFEADGCRIRVAGLPDVTTSSDDWVKWVTGVADNWKDMHQIVVTARTRRERVEAMERSLQKARYEANAAGFQIEQAPEDLNDRLPGGSAI